MFRQGDKVVSTKYGYGKVSTVREEYDLEKRLKKTIVFVRYDSPLFPPLFTQKYNENGIGVKDVIKKV